MLNAIQGLVWYPPAETKIPISDILSAFGRRCSNFKDELCSYLNVDNCILGESARALLFKLLWSLKKNDSGQRNEVLIPGYTCYSVAAAVAKAGLKITVYDLDPKTLHADMSSIKKALSEKTLAVIAQHLFGVMMPIDELVSIANKKGIYLIEDAAQAFGKTAGCKVAGTIGDFGLFSFGRGKPLPIGGGGALVSHGHSDVLKEIYFDSQEKGYKQAFLALATQFISEPAFYWIPEMLPLGLGKTVFNTAFKVKGMPLALEKILVRAISFITYLNSIRNRISDIYIEQIVPEYLLNHKKSDIISLIRFPVMIPNSKLMKGLEHLGVRRMYPKAISEENAIKPFLKENQRATPGAAEISKNLLTLPTHTGINDTVARRICHKINEYY